MLRRVLQLASFAALAGIALLYPLIESLDHFDSPLPASDLEIELIVLFTFIGSMFLLAHLLASVSMLALIDALRYLFNPTTTAIQSHDLAFSPLENPSPPIPLRI